MLIAIMGDTFAQATEQAEKNARITKIDIMHDYIALIDDRLTEKGQKKNNKKRKDEALKYIYVVMTEAGLT